MDGNLNDTFDGRFYTRDFAYCLGCAFDIDGVHVGNGYGVASAPSVARMAAICGVNMYRETRERKAMSVWVLEGAV